MTFTSVDLPPCAPTLWCSTWNITDSVVSRGTVAQSQTAIKAVVGRRRIPALGQGQGSPRCAIPRAIPRPDQASRAGGGAETMNTPWLQILQGRRNHLARDCQPPWRRPRRTLRRAGPPPTRAASARPSSITTLCSSPSSRLSVFRNDTRLRLDSMRVTSIPSSTIRSGIPGMPAPAPMSTTRRGRSGRSGKKRRESSKSPRTISGADSKPVRFWARFQSRSKSRYWENRPLAFASIGRPLSTRAVWARWSSADCRAPAALPHVTSLHRTSRRSDRGSRRPPDRPSFRQGPEAPLGDRSTRPPMASRARAPRLPSPDST